MNRLSDFASFPAGRELLADEVLELHAARILLLLRFCGTKDRIDGLTKLAKLDFFVRYPGFHDRATAGGGGRAASTGPMPPAESQMIRFKYGPWDDRYYHVLAFLESRGLVDIERRGRAFTFSLTESGGTCAQGLSENDAFNALVAQMRKVKKAFGAKTGSSLKKLIYGVFEDEITNLRLGKVIKHDV